MVPDMGRNLQGIMIHFNWSIMKVKANKNIDNHIGDDLDNEKLTIGKVYDVIAVEGEYYRIIDDDHEPILYNRKLFEVVDSNIPPDWVETIFDDEIFIEPLDTLKPGFYEDYFDGVPDVVQRYQQLLKKLCIKVAD